MRREINNRQPTMAERDTCLRVYPDTGSIRSSMREAIGHRADQRAQLIRGLIVAQIDEASNAAHWTMLMPPVLIL